MKVGPDIYSLIKAVYSNIEQNNLFNNFLRDRMLLSAQNDDVQDINSIVFDIFSGYKCTYLSADNIIIEDGAYNANIYSIEYLNSLNPSGIPLSKLDFKIGYPIMLLHNLAPCQKPSFISHITLTPTSTELSFRFKRRQFPIHCAFAITINKSQGQLFKHLYVALSRCTSAQSIKVLFPHNLNDCTTLTIFYPE
ncbi:45507_t:CDS:2, partial [Gigaspora margarita]